MALVCTEITEWVEEEVSKPVEEWEERQEKKCKDYPWYDPRGWVCWFVTYFVKVVRWVIVKVGKWVVRTVCKLVGVVVEAVVDIAAGLWDVVIGIVTLDWRRILDGLLRAVIGLVLGIIRLARIVFLGDTIDYIIEEINRERLRRYVRGLLEAKYSGDTLTEIKEAIRLDHGAFGLRLHGTAYRTTLDSETPSPREPAVPNLVVLHEQGAINLRELCGFEFPEGFWNRKRYKTLKKGTVLGGGGGGEFDNPISADELDTYLNSRGAQGPAFIVLPMRDGALDTKVATAREKGRELALMLDFDQETREVTDPDHIVHKGYDRPDAHPALTRFLKDVIGRHDKTTDPDGATADLCHPVAVGVFRYTDTLRGLANNLHESACGLSGKNTSGVTFIDNTPDQIWKYVPIHELGHTFGLCHTDGVDRIMYSPKTNTWWRKWYLIPRTILSVYLDGEPTFTFDEAKAAWDYIVAHFAPQCLGARPVVIGVSPATVRGGTVGRQG
ncbi:MULTISPECIES: hypothetical protein [Micromonospora]|uniref:Uncharacterized protein n=1 Tax=Micromonospora sicca TaxID=2202420 RepID=A0A317DB94_9ACTN|nr:MULTISPECIES: hypothetical protein [unclassified Micromonospora]MBM0226882.1 hypothetical protein [Micromonospora sp. ATA51]PWR10966.1 hypothetical protein DKT69_27710 [Micromonospora sp. 4G51]